MGIVALGMFMRNEGVEHAPKVCARGNARLAHGNP